MVPRLSHVLFFIIIKKAVIIIKGSYKIRQLYNKAFIIKGSYKIRLIVLIILFTKGHITTVSCNSEGGLMNQDGTKKTN